MKDHEYVHQLERSADIHIKTTVPPIIVMKACLAHALLVGACDESIALLKEAVMHQQLTEDIAKCIADQVPLSLEQAQASHHCRICHKPIPFVLYGMPPSLMHGSGVHGRIGSIVAIRPSGDQNKPRNGASPIGRTAGIVPSVIGAMRG